MYVLCCIARNEGVHMRVGAMSTVYIYCMFIAFVIAVCFQAMFHVALMSIADCSSNCFVVLIIALKVR